MPERTNDNPHLESKQELKTQGQKYRKKLYDLLTRIEKEWLSPGQTKNLKKTLNKLQDQHYELQTRATALNEAIQLILEELTSLRDSVQSPDQQKLTILVETLNALVSSPIEEAENCETV